MNNFLASVDIKAMVEHTSTHYTMLLLIGFTFFIPKVFLFSIYTHYTIMTISLLPTELYRNIVIIPHQKTVLILDC